MFDRFPVSYAVVEMVQIFVSYLKAASGKKLAKNTHSYAHNDIFSSEPEMVRLLVRSAIQQ